MGNKTIIAAALVIVFLVGILFFNSKTVENSRNQTGDTSSASTSSGLTELVKETTREGEGDREVATGDTISVHYTGTFLDGTKFDSSVDRGQPFQFTVGQGVIQGWSQGVIGMKKGEVRKLSIPSSLGYGSVDYGDIPANSDLYFEIELLDFVN